MHHIQIFKKTKVKSDHFFFLEKSEMIRIRMENKEKKSKPVINEVEGVQFKRF